jgi:hypothetical protein
MKILVKRIAKKATYTIGKMYLDGEFFCNTIEDKDRGLRSDMSLEEIKKIKIPSVTAIPTGTYKITIDVISPKFSKKAAYQYIGGKLPRLIGVKGFDGILIHQGTTEKDSAGCLIVGKNTIVGKVTQSQATFRALYAKMKEAKERGEEITITIE